MKQQGKKNVAAVAYTQANPKKKRKKADTKCQSEPSDGSMFQRGAVSTTTKIPYPNAQSESSPGSMFKTGPVSAIAKIPPTTRPKQSHPGNGSKIPQVNKTFCPFCASWIVSYKIAQHNTGIGHTQRLGSGIKHFWCQECQISVPEQQRTSHVCEKPSNEDQSS
jgi:hypothetical protein